MKTTITIPDSAKADIEEYRRETKIDPLERVQSEADKIIENVRWWCREKGRVAECDHKWVEITQKDSDLKNTFLCVLCKKEEQREEENSESFTGKD